MRRFRRYAGCVKPSTSNAAMIFVMLLFLANPRRNSMAALRPRPAGPRRVAHLSRHQDRLLARDRSVVRNRPLAGLRPGVRLLFHFWKTMRNCPNGIPMYVQHQVWMPNEE